ncbi:MAG: hypothetical protein A3B23_03565 [Candidatus Colwellbacteria bacterium RIFCSPLOWO2_01_FULL_48_10]|uniref:Response regulatory domain-containing protein n=1 Tax=Candidatus Colwellbacteria bacterium RIFCSPLOWO2_01_FULL_48_10 TaxID=1797690 RepID=A0A1G1Z539_9BACT|nr:MAG: hypothetical protein A3B23_03565 [Candidatus Colwellbacteria bacterium RIFCSPLOWO2_01_FULL_48_10]
MDTVPIGKTVLLVEDDVFLSNLLSSRLMKAGISVLKAYDGEEALKSLRAQKPDLIVLDIIIPKKSGFELMEDMRGEPILKDTPVIIVSNLGQEADVERAKQYGIKGYFVKAQNSIDDIALAIKTYLETGSI